MAREARAGNFTISDAPVASPEVLSEAPETEAAEIPGGKGTPFLLAIPRNPRTLFVCWNIDWPAAFGSDVPADRKAHLKLRSGTSELTQAVEPLSGHCAIRDLEAGARYEVELGYYGANETWRVIAAANKITMPLRSGSGDEEVEVTTILFHFSFQRILDVLGASEGGKIAQRLAQLQKDSGETRSEVLRTLDISVENLRKTAQRKEELTRTTPAPKRRRDFGSNSPVSSSWQSS